MYQLLLVLLSVVLQTPQTAAPATSTPVEKRECQIAGTVVARAGGEPIKNARLALRADATNNGDKHYGFKTGEDGKFCFAGVAPGRYRLYIQRNGYVLQAYGEDEQNSSSPVLAVSKEKKIEGLIVRLVRAGVIRGKVVDADGEPVPDALVQALLPEDEDSLEETEGEDTSRSPKNGFSPAQSAATNDLGEYRLSGLAPGDYIINAIDSAGRLSGTSFFTDSMLFSDADESADKYAPTYYPGVTRLEQATKVPLKAGEDATADIQLRHEKMVAVSGVLLHESGKPASKSLVTLSDENSLTAIGSASSQTDENGHFSIKQVLPGTYTAAGISMEPEDVADGLSARQKIEVGQQDVKDLRLVLTGGQTVAGTISAEGASLAKLSSAYVAFVGKDDDFSRGSNGSEKDGSFKITGLQPMTYQVSMLNLPEEYYLKRVVYSGQPSPDHLVKLEAGVPPGKLELVVSSHPATIAGTVEDSNHAPIGGVSVVLRVGSGKGKPSISPNHVITDQNGKFVFRGVPPGSYTVVARKRKKSGSPPDSGETSVKVSEDEQKSVTVKMQASS